jgi:hypothetical protein
VHRLDPGDRDGPALLDQIRGEQLRLGHSILPPLWYFNAVANPTVEIQDGATKQDMTARELAGAERLQWWKRFG